MGRKGDVGEVCRSAHVDVLLASLDGAPGADDVVLQLGPKDEISNCIKSYAFSESVYINSNFFRVSVCLCFRVSSNTRKSCTYKVTHGTVLICTM